jgi:hypothetical protein
VLLVSVVGENTLEVELVAVLPPVPVTDCKSAIMEEEVIVVMAVS